MNKVADVFSVGMMDSPSARLRRLIDRDKEALDWYRKKNPQADLTRRYNRLGEYDRVCREIEACEPLEVCRIIREKLTEARKQQFKPDVAMLYLPLTSEKIMIYNARPVIVDLVGWDLASPYDYDLIGINNAGGELGRFIASDTDTEGRRYGT